MHNHCWDWRMLWRSDGPQSPRRQMPKSWEMVALSERRKGGVHCGCGRGGALVRQIRRPPKLNTKCGAQGRCCVVSSLPRPPTLFRLICRYEAVKHWRGSEPSQRRAGAQNVAAGTVWSSDAIFAEEMLLFLTVRLLCFLWTPPAKQWRRDRINFRTKNCKGDEKFDEIRLV